MIKICKDKTACNPIASGSAGNCVLYHHGTIAVDMGVGFKDIEPHLGNLALILLTHKHKDHINVSTIKKIQAQRPSIRVGCCGWMLTHLEGVRNIDVFIVKHGNFYDYGAFKIKPVKLYHDVKNCGYRIYKNDFKIFHATDTEHLKGIHAKNYDIYSIEHNYDAETVEKSIRKKELKGDFSYQTRSINSHLSCQKAKEFIYANAKEDSRIIRLHESKTNH